MGKDKTTKNSEKHTQKIGSALSEGTERATGGELHQTAGGEHPALTTNQGVDGDGTGLFNPSVAQSRM
ncbi:MAG TPA: hypothetical protein DDY32_10250 [Desulfobulbaceae bacterium]|nr:hypothetical protein [Desulfobulbaceae bacterium]